MMSVGHVLGHVLDHVPDHVPDHVSNHMIIGLVATALQQGWQFGKNQEQSIATDQTNTRTIIIIAIL